MKREAMLKALGARREPWDIVVIGGGATGVGIALDAATRGYSVALFEAWDFGKGTSSRSTKLVHGGVRYLRNGQIGMVMEALEERGRLRRNAPDLVSDLSFVVPIYHSWEWAMYGAGLKAYDWLAGKYGFGKTQILSRAETIGHLPSVKREGLQGSILYHDGQFDDAALLIQIARTAADNGAVLVNYAPVLRDRRQDRHRARCGVGYRFGVEARIVINAAGPFSDRVRQLAEPGRHARWPPAREHTSLSMDRFFPARPRSWCRKPATGACCAIPWLAQHSSAPPIRRGTGQRRAQSTGVGDRLHPGTSRCCLARPPSRADVLSSFAGIRPLVLKGGGNTAALSRDHILRFERSGMLTIIGGKWTTYRHMAEDCVNHAARAAGLPERPCRTRELAIRPPDKFRPEPRLHPALPYGESHVAYAAREQMARTLEDVLGRRRELCS